jgi:hypothetical protein
MQAVLSHAFSWLQRASGGFRRHGCCAVLACELTLVDAMGVIGWSFSWP